MLDCLPVSSFVRCCFQSVFPMAISSNGIPAAKINRSSVLEGSRSFSNKAASRKPESIQTAYILYSWSIFFRYLQPLHGGTVSYNDCPSPLSPCSGHGIGIDIGIPTVPSEFYLLGSELKRRRVLTPFIPPFDFEMIYGAALQLLRPDQFPLISCAAGAGGERSAKVRSGRLNLISQAP